MSLVPFSLQAGSSATLSRLPSHMGRKAMPADSRCGYRNYSSPGLAPLHEKVLLACCHSFSHRRDRRCSARYPATQSRLLEPLGTTRDVLLVGGNGTQAMALAAANLINAGGRVLVVRQGEFGHRFADILNCSRADV